MDEEVIACSVFVCLSSFTKNNDLYLMSVCFTTIRKCSLVLNALPVWVEAFLEKNILLQYADSLPCIYAAFKSACIVKKLVF